MKIKHVLKMDKLQAYTLDGEGTLNLEIVALLVVEENSGDEFSLLCYNKEEERFSLVNPLVTDEGDCFSIIPL